MGKRSRFQAPRTLSDWGAVLRAFREVQESLDSISQSRAELRMNLRSFNLTAGNFHRASAPAAGLQARLPKASGENLGDAITLHLEGMLGQLDVFAAPGDTVNGAASAAYTADGVVALWSNGVNAWSSVAQTPVGGVGTPTWAQVLASGNTSGAFNPTIDSGQSLVFAGAGVSPADGDIDAAGDLTLDSVGDMHLHSHAGLHLGHVAFTGLVHVEASTHVDILSGGDILSQATTGIAVQAGTTWTLSTNSVSRLVVEADGSWNVGGSNGTAGQYLRSFGSAAPPQWATITVADIPTIVATTGAVSIPAGGGASLFAGIRNNGSATTDRANLNFANSTTTNALLVDDSGANEIEVYFTVNQTANFSWSGTHSFGSTTSFTNTVHGTGSVNSVLSAGTNSNLAIGAVNTVRVSGPGGGATMNLTGMVPTSDGQWVFVENTSSTDTLVIMHDVTSTAANRFYCASFADFTVSPRGGFWARYDGTLQRWMVARNTADGIAVELNNASPTGNTVVLDFNEGTGIDLTKTNASTGVSGQEVDLTIAVNTAANFTWTGTHAFDAGDLTIGGLEPTSILGSPCG